MLVLKSEGFKSASKITLEGQWQGKKKIRNHFRERNTSKYACEIIKICFFSAAQTLFSTGQQTFSICALCTQFTRRVYMHAPRVAANDTTKKLPLFFCLLFKEQLTTNNTNEKNNQTNRFLSPQPQNSGNWQTKKKKNKQNKYYCFLSRSTLPRIMCTPLGLLRILSLTHSAW